jgi:hypothetical protein
MISFPVSCQGQQYKSSVVGIPGVHGPPPPASSRFYARGLGIQNNTPPREAESDRPQFRLRRNCRLAFTTPAHSEIPCSRDRGYAAHPERGQDVGQAPLSRDDSDDETGGAGPQHQHHQQQRPQPRQKRARLDQNTVASRPPRATSSPTYLPSSSSASSRA